MYVQVTPISGDPDLFVRVTDGYYPTSIDIMQPADAHDSGAGAHEMEAASASTSCRSRPTRQGSCNPVTNANCGPPYTIGVNAYFRDAEWYIVTASTSKSLIEISNGLTVGPYHADQQRLGLLLLPRRDHAGHDRCLLAGVASAATRTCTCRPLYAYPNATNAQWRSTTAAHDLRHDF